MRQRRSRFLVAGLISLVAVIALVAGIAVGSAHVSASSQSHDPDAHHAQQIVDTYLNILDTGMSTSQCDFSQMSTIYTADAKVTATGGPFAPGGPFGPGGAFGEQQFQGIQAVTGFYTKLCHILYTKLGTGPSWTQDAGFLLSPNVLNSYEHVSASGQLIGRCMHVFTISGDHIASLDWSVYA